jgi:hypothetical protein
MIFIFILITDKIKNLRRQRDSTNASELDSLPAPPQSLERFSSLSLTAIAEHLTELCARLKLPERKQESGRDIYIYMCGETIIQWGCATAYL